MKIVVLDGFTLNPGDLNWSGLEALGECAVYERTQKSEILTRIGDAEIVFTNKTPLTRETFAAKPRIRYVGVLATGYNIVDTEAAKEAGVIVTNIPTYGTTAVSQYVFALLLELCHHVPYHASTVVAGRWGRQDDFCYWDYPLIELAGKTLGIIGFGRIGQATAKIAAAFGMNVVFSDIGRNPALETEHIRYAELDELFRKSDVISLHCPLTPDNLKLINRKSISRMKDGVMIINTARGQLIDEDDLYAALHSGKVGGAALDVLYAEPPKAGSVLIGAPNCIVTPHIAWAPLESRARLMAIAVDSLKSFLAGNPVHVVNR